MTSNLLRPGQAVWVQDDHDEWVQGYVSHQNWREHYWDIQLPHRIYPLQVDRQNIRTDDEHALHALSL